MICESPLEWKRRVCMSGKCIVHVQDPSRCAGPLQAHHVLSQQHLRKHGLNHLRWETNLGVPICEKGHTKHTQATQRIKFEHLPSHVTRFIEELGFAWYLERYYEQEATHDGAS